MIVTLFDLDHTLLPLDTNQAWVAFLCQIGALDAAHYLPAAAAMKQRYLAGGDDPDVDFCEFFIGLLSTFENCERDALRARFISQVVLPAISAPARQLVEQHRAAGDALAIITATNRYITAPIAAAFGIDHLIATECQLDHGRMTGRVSGVPSMRSGKVTRLAEWLKSGALPGICSSADINLLRFYSDSINDRALLEAADEAIAVDPDRELQRLADRRGWPVISLI